MSVGWMASPNILCLQIMLGAAAQPTALNKDITASALMDSPMAEFQYLKQETQYYC